MLRWLAGLDPQQFAALCSSTSRGGWTEEETADAVLSGRWKCFAFPGGLVAVSKAGDTMTVEGIAASGWGWIARHFRDAMDRLATDWQCNTVETLCFDSRLAAAMVKIEARPVAVLLEWQVKGMSRG